MFVPEVGQWQLTPSEASSRIQWGHAILTSQLSNQLLKVEEG